jgi:AbrB family looped-hinge helix DNA binding protein
MSRVTVSPKYQVVIPKEARAALNIRPGEKVEVFSYKNRLEFVPVRPMASLRGFVKGIDTTVDREPDRL